MKTQLTGASCILICLLAWIDSRRGPEDLLATELATSRPAAAAAGVADRAEETPYLPNLGQWAGEFDYLARFGPMTAFVDRGGWTLDLTGTPTSVGATEIPCAAVRMRLASGPAKRFAEGHRLAGVHHYFLGNDPTHWRSDVPRLQSIDLLDVRAGIDLRVHSRDGTFEYDVILAPSADLHSLEFAVEGADALEIDAVGNLCIRCATGVLTQRPPVTALLHADGSAESVEARFALRGPRSFGFAVDSWSGAETLVIDPGIVYCTFLGGSFSSSSHSGADAAIAPVIDDAGILTIAGETDSANFPTTLGAYSRTIGGFSSDVYLTQIDPSQPRSQQLRFSTFLGGSLGDAPSDLASSTTGVFAITGRTLSSNFPATSGTWDSTFGGNSFRGDGFVALFDPSRTGLQQLVYSTYLGGSFDERANAVRIDAQGRITVVGQTDSSDFPMSSGAFRSSWVNGEAFVAQLDPALPAAQQLVFSSFLGGSAGEEAMGVDLDSGGTITVVGTTGSSDYPVTPGALALPGTLPRVFLSQLDPARSGSQQLLYSTTIGGSADDIPRGIALDANGRMFVAGRTLSADFPTTANALQTTGGGWDVFFMVVDPRLVGLQQLAYSARVGGSGPDFVRRMIVSEAGVATLGGSTFSSDFPTTPGAHAVAPISATSTTDAFLLRLDPWRPPARQLIYSTYLGGSSDDEVLGLAENPHGALVAVGSANGSFPTTPDGLQQINGGSGGAGGDGFACVLDMLPAGVTTIGRATKGCTGSPLLSVTSMPRIGNAAFEFTCSRAPSGGVGLIAVCTQELATPVAILGTDIWIDPATILSMDLVFPDSRGVGDHGVTIPGTPSLVGVRAVAQCAWLEPAGPLPCPLQGVSASNALAVVVQP